jgi:hypothetical protein
MGDDIEINVTETTNIIEITPQPNDQIVDISVIDNAPNVELNITPSVIEINVTRGSSTAIWGAITGNIDDQTDLATKFGLKADLVDGKVPSSQLPSYVDDIIEVANYAALPTTGETGKIYITLNNNKVFRWSGSTYIEIAANNAVWGAITGTLSSQTDLQTALNAKFNNPTGDTTQYLAGDGTLITFPTILDSGNLICLVRNQSGATISAGSLVYISSGSGNKPLISLSQANTEGNSSRTFGMVRNSIANNANGYVVINGQVTDLNTSAFTEGNILYLSPTTAGGYTTTKPSAPNHMVYVGEVIYAHPTHGTIQTRIQNGFELEELHNVAISSVTNNDVLTYESSSSLWKNKSLSTILGYTPSNDSNVVHITGNETITGLKKFTDFLSTDKAYNQKIISGGYMPDAGYANIQQNDRQITFAQFNAAATAITQFSFIYPDSNTSQFYYVPNASGTLALTSQLHNAVTLGTANGLTLSGQALSLGLASSSANGAISSTDWSTFNNKENAVAAGSTLQYYRGDKNWATLNTSVVPELTNLYYTEARVNANTNVAANTAARHNAVTIGTANGLSLSTQVLSLALASSSTNGALSSTDYTYFFDKVQGNGTNNYIAKYTSTGKIIGNSLIYDNGTNVGIGTTSPGSASSNTILGFVNGSNIQARTSVPQIAMSANIDGDWYAPTYKTSNFASQIFLDGNAGAIGLRTASSGTAGGAITWNVGLRMDSSGNVGIGTTAPNTLLQIGSGSGATTNSMMYLGGYNTTTSQMRLLINHSGAANAGIGTPSSGGLLFGYGLVDGTILGEWMRITSGGSVCIGTTSAFDSGIVCSDGGTSYVPYTAKIGTTSNSTQIFFRNPNGVVGSISTSGSVTLFNSMSDYRLKQDLKNINGLDLVSKIKVYNYEWKSDKSRSYGVLAHELQEVVPQAVTGEKDGEQMQSVDYSKLVPILVQAIQELKAEIEILKAK